MSRELSSHCQCDNCSGDDCRDLPKTKTISDYTISELVDELCKRTRNVECIPVTAAQLYASVQNTQSRVQRFTISKRVFVSSKNIGGCEIMTDNEPYITVCRCTEKHDEECSHLLSISGIPNRIESVDLNIPIYPRPEDEWHGTYRIMVKPKHIKKARSILFP